MIGRLVDPASAFLPVTARQRIVPALMYRCGTAATQAQLRGSAGQSLNGIAAALGTTFSSQDDFRGSQHLQLDLWRRADQRYRAVELVRLASPARQIPMVLAANPT
jgi:hypothetical protein